MPAMVQVRNERDGKSLFVDLCIIHLRIAPKAVEEMHLLRQDSDPHLLSQEKSHGQEET